MSQFTIHSIASANAVAKPLLEGSLKKYGFVPNLHGGLAEAPAALQAYIDLTALFDESSLSPVERQVVLIATSVENGCAYCVAAHSTIARHMVKADPSIVQALRAGTALPNHKLDALASFTRTVVKHRGKISNQALERFFGSGYTHAQVLEVLLGVAFKTLSNYTNHLIDTPLDTAFQSEAWEEPQHCSPKQCA